MNDTKTLYTSTRPTLSGKIFDELPSSIQSYTRFLEGTIKQQEAALEQQQTHIEQLQARLDELESRLSKNSSNSSKPPSSDGCGSDLAKTTGTCKERRQIFDIPEPKIQVTEHRTEEKICPCCKLLSSEKFHEGFCLHLLVFDCFP